MLQPRLTRVARRLGTETVRWLILFPSFILLSGCVSWNSADGTRHTLVLGLGLISTKTSPDQSATAIRSNTLGLAVGGGGPSGGLVLGYQSLQQTSISPDWQGVVQVNAAPGQPLTLEGHATVPQAGAPTTTNIKGEQIPCTWQSAGP
ncbi:MAG: hypothetical protein ACHQ2F_07295 [Desulfobaccales bacterium]